MERITAETLPGLEVGDILLISVVPHKRDLYLVHEKRPVCYGVVVLNGQTGFDIFCKGTLGESQIRSMMIWRVTREEAMNWLLDLNRIKQNT